MGTRRDGGAAKHRGASERMGALAKIFDLSSLNVHSADEHDLRPQEVLRGGAPDVLVDEPELPASREVSGNHEQSLGGHVCAHAVGQGVRKFQGAERRGVMRKDEQNSPYAELVRKSHDCPPYSCIADRRALALAQPKSFHLLTQELAFTGSACA